MKDRCNECRYKMERHGIIDGEDVYYCDICGIYQSYPLDEEALLAAETYAAEKKNCGCGKDPCVTYGAESEKKPEKDHNCISCGHHSAHITMGDDKFCYDCYHYAETFNSDYSIMIDGEEYDADYEDEGGYHGDDELDQYVEEYYGDDYNWVLLGQHQGHDIHEILPNFVVYDDDKNEHKGIAIVFEAETFNSYKVAPELSSYTVDELVDSIAGPQGSAAYDEMVYDPIAQDRLSAESFSLPHTLLLLGGIAAGLGFGVFLTKNLNPSTPETSDEGGA